MNLKHQPIVPAYLCFEGGGKPVVESTHSTKVELDAYYQIVSFLTARFFSDKNRKVTNLKVHRNKQTSKGHVSVTDMSVSDACSVRKSKKKSG